MLVYQRVGFFSSRLSDENGSGIGTLCCSLALCGLALEYANCNQNIDDKQLDSRVSYFKHTHQYVHTFFFFLIPCFFQQLLLTLICPDAFSAVEKRQPAFGWGLPQVKLGHPFWPQSKWVAQPYVWDLASQLLTCGCRHQERNSCYFQDHPNSCLLRCTVWCSFPFCTKFSEMQTHFPAWLSLTVSLLIS